MQNTFLRETVYDVATNAPRAMSGVKNDLTPTTQAQINNTYNVMNYVPDLSTTTYLLQYLRAYYTPRTFYNYGGTLTDLQARASLLAANASTCNFYS